MFNVGDTILYGKEGVCTLCAVEERSFMGEKHKYYVLDSLSKPNSKLFVPVDNEKLVGSMRRLLSAVEIDSMINEIKASSVEWDDDVQHRKEEYSKIIANADCLEMGRTLRNIYYKKEELKKQGKKLRRTDEEFFIQGQKLFFNEISHVLKIGREDVLRYITE